MKNYKFTNLIRPVITRNILKKKNKKKQKKKKLPILKDPH